MTASDENQPPDGDSSPKVFVYRIQQRKGLPTLRGEILAEDEADAERQLRLKLLSPSLPPHVDFEAKEEIDARERAAKSRNVRLLLDILRAHHDWLRGDGGERADFTGRNMSGLKLPRLDLSMANLSGCDFSGTDLSESKLQGANLAGSNLAGANLKDADLSGADLSDANLKGSNLSGANLDGADLWRANLMGVEVAPDVLHRALSCRHPGSNQPND
ncbi:pentapeptide repeat-containing protein [Dongia rigui]|uniref:Pentapeptide repeat-containing protein n=1 Tax=Dongia rigui TaxID=940149 RepID=A0ABU5E0Q2_9PROT|nr:pentapeptide repeat-containing protein [Dongia rigui]MDY0873130.1 pentapeptide repeat-containing protein [Dongia rigui]